MRKIFEKKQKVTYSNTDFNLKLSLISAFDMVQDSTTEFFETIGADNVTEKIKKNAAWVLAKKKIHIYNYPVWNQELNIKSYIVEVSNIKIKTETVFTDQFNNVLMVCEEESCPIDIDTRKIRKIDSICFPKDFETEKSKFDETFMKLKDPFYEEDFLYAMVVKVSDIDFSRHVNNARYVRYLIDSFKSSFLKDNEITYIELHYINEAKENTKLKVYKKEIGSQILFLIKEEEKEILRANVIINKK